MLVSYSCWKPCHEVSDILKHQCHLFLRVLCVVAMSGFVPQIEPCCDTLLIKHVAGSCSRELGVERGSLRRGPNRSDQGMPCLFQYLTPRLRFCVCQSPRETSQRRAFLLSSPQTMEVSDQVIVTGGDILPFFSCASHHRITCSSSPDESGPRQCQSPSTLADSRPSRYRRSSSCSTENGEHSEPASVLCD